MERIPNGRYTQEFREEAVKMATEMETSKRLSLPKTTLENWIGASKAKKGKYA
jgi:transposase-like protein